MNEPGQPIDIGPLPDPAVDPVARRLVEVLESEAARIEPAERLALVRAAAARPRRAWRPLVAGVGAVALVGVGAWAALDQAPRHPTSKPLPAASTPSTLPSPIPTATPSSSASATASAGTRTFAAPVYYLARNSTGLFREFHPVTITRGPAGSDIAAAVRLAMDPSAVSRPALDFSPWLATTSRSVRISLTGSHAVLVTLPDAEKSARGASREQARLAAQQLVWTASAVAQDPSLSVRIAFAHGSGRLFGVLPVSQLFHRPPASQAYRDLSAIWVLQPADGATTSSPVTFTGQACTFEANVAWQVRTGRVSSPAPNPVRSSRFTASAGCPVRATWSVSVGGLSPGTYTFIAYELSAKGDGSYEGLDAVTFTVR